MIMSDAVAPRIVSFSSVTPETTVSKPSPDRLLGGDPQQTARNYFSDATSQFFAGVWESTPGRWRVRYTENEFCHITAGEVRIESHSGEAWVFKTGDSFVIPSGFSGIWHVTQSLRKLYVIFEPASN
jgi:uncharacterized cupin superfamily protein